MCATAWRDRKQKPHLLAKVGKRPGNGLFSQTVSSLVSSALKCFTTVFGMGTGGSTTLGSPGHLRYNSPCNAVQEIDGNAFGFGQIQRRGQFPCHEWRSRIRFDANEDADGADHGSYGFSSFEGPDVGNG